MIAFAFDTETTGLIDNHVLRLEMQPEIIEFYGCFVDLSAGEILIEMDFQFKPRYGVPEDTTKITGLTAEDLADAPPFSTSALAIRTAIETSGTVIAHNLSFDMEMLALEFERIPLPPLKWPALKICTVEQTIHLKGFRLGLNNLHELLFGEPFKEAHRAKTDVMATVRCACELFKRGEI